MLYSTKSFEVVVLLAAELHSLQATARPIQRKKARRHRQWGPRRRSKLAPLSGAPKL